jgi:hypothetical protein
MRLERSDAMLDQWRRRRWVDVQEREAYVVSEAKRRAQDALFSAIADQAETNMKSALRPGEKGALLHELAEAYRLTAGVSTAAPNVWTAPNGEPAGDAERVGAAES